MARLNLRPESIHGWSKLTINDMQQNRTALEKDFHLVPWWLLNTEAFMYAITNYEIKKPLKRIVEFSFEAYELTKYFLTFGCILI